MAVTVVTRRDTDGTIYAKDVVKTGTYYRIDDGGVLVVEANGHVTAIYAAGQWVSAFSDASTEVGA